MKIGYLIQKGVLGIRNPPYTGPANHIREVIKELQELGHEVSLLARVDGKFYKSDDLQVFVPIVVRWMDRGPFRLLERVIRRVQSEFHLPYFTIFESLRFASACCQEFRDSDIFYERSTWVAYGAGLAARWLGIPLVLEENGNPLLMMDALGNAPHGLQRKLECTLMDMGVRLASHVVASGDGWREHFIERFAVDPSKVTTVENGTRLVSLLNREQLRSFRTSTHDSESAQTLVYLGGFHPWHGVEILIRALHRAIGTGLSLHLLLIGSGPGVDQAKSLANELGLEKDITFTGHLLASEYALLLADSDIALSPYCGWVEFSGLKIIDYKAAGLAIIASGKNGKPATVRHNHSGIVIPPCEEDALTQAIIDLASNADLRQCLGRQARIEAENHHTWRHTAMKLEHLFQELV